MGQPIITDLQNEILDLLESTQSAVRMDKLWLGGSAGPSGGQGLRPGGFIGQLIQTKVAYDTTEAATATTSGSPSLLDNLNHIRYNVATISGLIGEGSFLNLSDVPVSYTGQAGKVVSVNETETGLEFVTATTGSGSGSGGEDLHGLYRCATPSGTYSLDLPDDAYRILSLNNNGFLVDPFNYTLSGYSTVVLTYPTIGTTIFTIDYILLQD